MTAGIRDLLELDGPVDHYFEFELTMLTCDAPPLAAGLRRTWLAG